MKLGYGYGLFLNPCGQVNYMCKTPIVHTQYDAPVLQQFGAPFAVAIEV
jgi:hypothetical protein